MDLIFLLRSTALRTRLSSEIYKKKCNFSAGKCILYMYPEIAQDIPKMIPGHPGSDI